MGFRYCFTLVQLFRGIPLLFYPDTSFSWDCTKLKSGILYQRAHSKFCLGAGYQRDSSFLRQFSAGINRERLSPVTGAAFPASVRAPISCQSLSANLVSEALQCARTRALSCFLPARELDRVEYPTSKVVKRIGNRFLDYEILYIFNVDSGTSRLSSTRTHCEASECRAALASATEPNCLSPQGRVWANGG